MPTSPASNIAPSTPRADPPSAPSGSSATRRPTPAASPKSPPPSPPSPSSKASSQTSSSTPPLPHRTPSPAGSSSPTAARSSPKPSLSPPEPPSADAFGSATTVAMAAVMPVPQSLSPRPFAVSPPPFNGADSKPAPRRASGITPSTGPPFPNSPVKPTPSPSSPVLHASRNSVKQSRQSTVDSRQYLFLIRRSLQPVFHVEHPLLRAHCRRVRSARRPGWIRGKKSPRRGVGTAAHTQNNSQSKIPLKSLLIHLSLYLPLFHVEHLLRRAHCRRAHRARRPGWSVPRSRGAGRVALPRVWGRAPNKPPPKTTKTPPKATSQPSLPPLFHVEHLR